MKEILLAINTLLSTPQVDKSMVQSLLHVSLKEDHRTPHWVYFLGQGRAPVAEVDFRQSTSDKSWLLALRFDIEKSPRRAAVPLDQYGPLVSLEPNPDVPPEGITTYEYAYNEISVSFSFTSQTDSLYGIALSRD